MVNYFTVANNEINDISYYLSPAQIIDSFVHSLNGVQYHPILSCKDKVIRILDSDKNDMIYSFKLPAVCNCMEPWEDLENIEYTNKKKLTNKMLFGLENGNIFCFELQETEPKLVWIQSDDENTASVNICKAYDFSARGKTDQIVAREDGDVQIWGMTSETTFELRGFQKLEEAVVGLDCGIFTDSQIHEILVSTFNGKIIGLVDEEKKNQHGTGFPKDVIKQNDRRIPLLKKEIDQLELELQTLKESISGENIVPPTNNKVSWKISKVEKTNFFRVIVDSQYSMEMVSIECSKSILISPMVGKSGIFSETPDEFSNIYNFYAFNFHEEKAYQMEFQVRLIEVGHEGDLRCFIVPGQDSAVAQTIHIPIKPLGLHEPIDNVPDGVDEGIVWSTLSVEGDFAVDELNSWMFNIVPDLSSNVDGDVCFFLI